MDCFAATVEALFEASDDDPKEIASALADRKTELLRFCKALSELAGTESSAHSLLVAQTTYSYPKADALAALSEVVKALRAYLQTSGPTCITAPSQAESPGAGCVQANAENQLPVMGTDGPAGQAKNTAWSSGSPVADLEGTSAGDMQQLSMKQSFANSDVDILNTPTSQSQRALVTRLGMPSEVSRREPDLTPVDSSNGPAAGSEEGPQPGDGGMALQPADLTESQLLVPDSYPSDRPADEAHPVLIGDCPAGLQPEAQYVVHAETQYQDVLIGDGQAEPQPEAQPQDVVHAGTQYQDVMEDEEMPEQQLSGWRAQDQEAEEEVQMEEDGMGTENQENCSLHSNSQAPAAYSQGKKGSQEDNARASASPERPALHGMSDEAQADHQEPDTDVDLEAARADAEADAGGDSVGNKAFVEAHEDPPADAEAMHAPEAEEVAVAEEDFRDAQAVPSTDAESDEGSSESDYDSPSWQGSEEDLLFGSEQQDKAAKSQSESQVTSFSM